MVTTFTAEKITQLRQAASKAAQLPKQVPEGWSKSVVDPMAVLAVFKPLRIKEGFVLRAYQFHGGGNGNGFVWAIPVDADFPNPEECPRLQHAFLEPPKPPLALNNCMDAIDGDGTPWSYMCASLVARELTEFGAMWHGCDWHTHRILDTDPWEETSDSSGDGLEVPVEFVTELKWSQPRPINWRPQVAEDGGRITVTFFTLSELGGVTIYRHTDVYTAGDYTFAANRQEIAAGGGGFVY